MPDLHAYQEINCCPSFKKLLKIVNFMTFFKKSLSFEMNTELSNALSTLIKEIV